MTRLALLILLLFASFSNVARAFYDPAAGRWVSRDPIGEMGGRNLYGMVGNNAVGNVDRFGLEPALPPGWTGPGRDYDPTHNPFSPLQSRDDFGRLCCGDKMQIVSIMYHPTEFEVSKSPPFLELVDSGHASIVTPNTTAGLWPGKPTDKHHPSQPGDMHTGNEEDLSDHTHRIDYRACPKSVESIDEYIRTIEEAIARGENPFGGAPGEEYDFLNKEGSKSCFGFACEAIEQAGGDPPANPTPQNPVIPENMPGSTSIP